MTCKPDVLPEKNDSVAALFAAVLFDCDGVLVDSEAITLTVLRNMLAELGWEMSLEACMRQFLGRLVRDNAALIEQHTGQPMTQAWMDAFLRRRDAALSAQLTAIDGVQDALTQIERIYGTRIACASGADRRKINLQLNKVALTHYFAGRIFSGFEMAQSKPAPDVYLAAAAHLRVDPSHCAVIEDSPTGVRAGVAAGATVFAYVAQNCPSVQALGGVAAVSATLLGVGAYAVFSDMRELPGLLAK
jgi:HAD superfamily hydrolase (TIGR01509 family)